jgi:hypothetical protein
VAPLTAQCPHSYLHSCDPPIIHGNLTCDTIFIQHNGLIKIGSGEGRERFWAGEPREFGNHGGKIKGMGEQQILRYELVITERLLVEVIHRERPISGNGLGYIILYLLERTLE